jgi:hypothetical protein
VRKWERIVGRVCMGSVKSVGRVGAQGGRFP